MNKKLKIVLEFDIAEAVGKLANYKNTVYYFESPDWFDYGETFIGIQVYKDVPIYVEVIEDMASVEDDPNYIQLKELEL